MAKYVDITETFGKITGDIAELFLRGRITHEEALELAKIRRQRDREVHNSGVAEGAAIRTFNTSFKFKCSRKR